MSAIKNILTMDMATLARHITRFWLWWWGEIAAIFPGGGRARRARACLVAERMQDRFLFREYRPGASLPTPRIGAAEKLLPAATVLLPPSEVLEYEVALPALPAADLRRAVTFDIDRYTPFFAADVVFDLDVEREAAAGMTRVHVAVVRRDTLSEMLAFSNQTGGMPRAIAASIPGTGAPRFDFLKALRETDGTAPARLRSTPIWIAAILIFILNITVLVLRDSASVTAIQEAVLAQEPSVRLAANLRQRIESEASRRRNVMTRRSDRAPLRYLAAVTNALPDGAYLQRLEWNGQVLRLVGVAKSGVDVGALLEASPMLRAVRPAGAVPSGQSGAFDLVAEPERGKRR